MVRRPFQFFGPTGSAMISTRSRLEIVRRKNNDQSAALLCHRLHRCGLMDRSGRCPALSVSTHHDNRPIRRWRAVDAFVRLIGDTIQGAWGQPVVMDPRSGAGGIIGTQVVANAAPDGYTLLMGNIGPLAINPTLYSSLPYDVETQLASVALVATYPNVLVVNPSLPIHSIADLIRYAKEKPGTLNFASAGIGQSQHLSGEMFKSMADIDIVHVAYKGTGPALTDLLSGSVQMMFSNSRCRAVYRIWQAACYRCHRINAQQGVASGADS
jgi:Tripartite tricarboxylate transporter family receptor